MSDEVSVPAEDAGELAFLEFAISYNAYDVYGSFENLVKVVRTQSKRWERTGSLPEDIDTLRAMLFFEQRAHHHRGEYAGSFDQLPMVRALMGEIRQHSGGRVPVVGGPV